MCVITPRKASLEIESKTAVIERGTPCWSHKDPLLIENTWKMWPGEKERVWALSKINRFKVDVIYRAKYNLC